MNRQKTASILASLLLAVMFFTVMEQGFAAVGVYSDIRDASTREAVQVLEDRGAVQAAAKFFPGRLVNRAELAKMAALSASSERDSQISNQPCFSDVPATAWFAQPACFLAKEGMNGIYDPVTGKRFFRPERHVTYAEALNMLFLAHDRGLCNGFHEPWYVACMGMARSLNVDLPLAHDRVLTRADAARLVVRFVVLAEASGSSSSSTLSSSTSSTSSSSTSSSSSSVSWPSDARADTDIRSQYLLLGETSAILGSAKVFLYEEPLILTKIAVNLTVEVPTVQSFSIFDQNRNYLGPARLDPSASTNRKYTLSLPSEAVIVPQRAERTFYARANLKTYNDGGQSNQAVQISDFTFEGEGFWSNQHYTKQSSESFLPFKTARATIVSVVNPKDAKAPLVPGVQREIGYYRFTGRRTDSNANIRVTDIVFTIGQTGGVQISNVRLGTDGLTETITCTVSSTSVTCSSIPDTYLFLGDQPRTIRLYGDVTVPSPSTSASLQLTINEPGSASLSGDVSWTDGTSNFTWVAVDGPVAQGTYYSY